MTLKLEHYTIRCRALERTRDFYRDALGLVEGPRPNFGFAGYWLYSGDIPVVHLVAEDGAVGGRDDAAEATGRLDHIAFGGTDYAAMSARLKAQDIGYRENHVPDFGIRQIFVRDPDGILVELNFRG
jgi:catechol 2,3-dioxygenase-like lactoylglutathione lyase family enzyme